MFPDSDKYAQVELILKVQLLSVLPPSEQLSLKKKNVTHKG